jgi:hypothetical protein
MLRLQAEHAALLEQQKLQVSVRFCFSCFLNLYLIFFCSSNSSKRPMQSSRPNLKPKHPLLLLNRKPLRKRQRKQQL